jgi:hypothetical protein
MSHDLLTLHGLPGRKDYKALTPTESILHLIEIDVPIFNEKPKRIATIQIFFEKALSEKQVYFFGIKDEDYHITEEPK